MVRIQSAIDLEAVVADAKHKVDDLDRAHGSIGLELAVYEVHGTETDASREDRRFTEGLRVAGAVSRAEVEVLGQA